MYKEFKEQALFRLSENTPRITQCLSVLTEEQVWQKSNKHSNSIGNLILHLCGNITQYIISTLGKSKDTRDRNNEFSTFKSQNKRHLLQKLEDTLQLACKIIENIDEKDLTQRYAVQGFQFSGTGIILHVVEHYSYHTGQIALWTKLIKDIDLGFYKGVDLNAKN